VLIPVGLFARAIARQRGLATIKLELSDSLRSSRRESSTFCACSPKAWTTIAMSDRLGIAPHTVEWHVRHVIEKLQVHSKLQAVLAAARKGLIEL
jgi:Bacterial regulatory proteins, luxR family